MNKAVFHFVMLRAEKGEILHCLQELHSAGGEYLEDIPPAMKLSLSEKRIREIFYIGVILKGIDGVIETIAGFALMFVSHAQLGTVVSFFTREELFEDPHDTIANYLTHSFHTFSGASQHFSALYLLVHGVVKMALVVGLVRNRLWAYPAAIAVFTALGLYQTYYAVVDRSLLLTALNSYPQAACARQTRCDTLFVIDALEEAVP